MAYVVEMPALGREGPVNHAQSSPWLVMACRREGPGTDSHGIDRAFPKYSDFSTLVTNIMNIEVP